MFGQDMDARRLQKKLGALKSRKEFQQWKVTTSARFVDRAKAFGLILLSDLEKRALLLRHQNLLNTIDDPREYDLLKTEVERERSNSWLNLLKTQWHKIRSVTAWQTSSNRLENLEPKLARLMQSLRDSFNQSAEPLNASDALYQSFVQRETDGLIPKDIDIDAKRLFKAHKDIQDLQSHWNLSAGDFILPKDDQKNLIEKLRHAMGLQDPVIKLEEGSYPLCRGFYDDVAVGLSYHDDFIQTVLDAVHEFGHALYRVNLPEQYRDSVKGDVAGAAMDEAMALFFENYVARSHSFAALLHTLLSETLPAERMAHFDITTLHKKLISVETPGQTIPDFVRYPVFFSYLSNTEDRLLKTFNLAAFDSEPASLAAIHDEEYQNIFGRALNDPDAEARHRIHLFAGEVGRFPSYLAGDLIAGQLFERFTSDTGINILENQSELEFEPIIDWLSRTIYSKGHEQPASQIAESATGQPLTAEALYRFVDQVNSQTQSL